MNVKAVLLLLNLMILPLTLSAEKALREIDRNGITWVYERGAASVIMGIESSSSDLHKLEFPGELGGKPVIAIFDEAFKSCEYLVEIVIPAGIRVVGKEAFANCSNLVRVTMEGGDDCVKSIGIGAFENCKKLEVLGLPEGLESIADDAFYGCDALREIVLPTNCTYAVEGFSNCRGLKRIDIGNVFEFVENHGSFIGCESLAEIIVPKDNKRFDVFDGILYTSDGVSLVRCPPKLAKDEITVRDGVFRICPQAFDGCSVRSVTLPDSLDSIGYEAFRGCTNLISMTIQPNLRIVGQKAFAGCSNLKSVVFLGDKRPTICDDAFPPNVKQEFRNSMLPISCDSIQHSCRQCMGGFVLRRLSAASQEDCAKQVEICSLDEHCANSGPNVLKIPDVIDGYKVTHIAPQAFACNQNIVAVEISSNVCQIGCRAFYGCSNLVSVSMSDCAFHPMSIHSDAFCRCVRLATLRFPVGLKMLADRAFAECSSLKNVKLPDSCDTMVEDVFWGCQSLQSIYIGNIGRHDEDRLISAFLNCPALEKISVHPDNPAYVVYDGALYYKDLKAILRCPVGLDSTKFVIRDGVKVVCPFAFAGCQFKEISLPESLVGIGQGAFADCTKLVSVNIPSGVRVIDDYAFWGCSNLVFVVMNGNEMPSLGTNAFPARIKNFSTVGKPTASKKTNAK